MALTLEQLRNRPTRAEVLDVIVGELASIGFETTSWQSGSIQRTLLTGVAAIGADVSSLAVTLVKSVYNRHAFGAALRELSISDYGNSAQLAQRTVGPVTLVSTAATPYDVEVNQLVASTTNNVEFRNVEAGTIPAGGSVTLEFEAMLAGGQGNVPNNAITLLKTPVAGVTISNPAGGNGIWYTTAGADPEPAAKLRQRNSARWGTLNQIAMPTGGYEFLALSVPAVTKVLVDNLNPRGPNTIDVYIATASGPPTSTELTAVQTLLNLKAPPGVSALAKSPTVKQQDVAGIVYIEAARNTLAKQSQVLAAIGACVNAAPIGGYLIGTSRIFPRSELITAISEKAGVTAINLTTPPTDVALNPVDLVTLGSTSGLFFAGV